MARDTIATQGSGRSGSVGERARRADPFTPGPGVAQVRRVVPSPRGERAPPVTMMFRSGIALAALAVLASGCGASAASVPRRDAGAADASGGSAGSFGAGGSGGSGGSGGVGGSGG